MKEPSARFPEGFLKGSAAALVLAAVAGMGASGALAAATAADTAQAGAETTQTAPAMSVDQLRSAMAEAEARRLEELKPDPTVPPEILERWGVEVISISRAVGGYMLDFRFRVVDDEKALPLFDHRIKPYVTVEKSGINLPVPVAAKVGGFRPTNRGSNIKADKTYYMLFGNPDSHVKPGEKVSVVIGDFRVENLTVR